MGLFIFHFFLVVTCVYLVLHKLLGLYNHFGRVRDPRRDGVVRKHNLQWSLRFPYITLNTVFIGYSYHGRPKTRVNTFLRLRVVCQNLVADDRYISRYVVHLG